MTFLSKILLRFGVILDMLVVTSLASFFDVCVIFRGEYRVPWGGLYNKKDMNEKMLDLETFVALFY